MRMVAAAAAAREEPGERFIDLGRGNPDIPPPAHAIRALRESAGETTATVHGYPPFAGHAELRRAIARRYALDHGVELDPEREVTVVPGTKTAIMLACMAAAGPGDTVLLPDPGYADYPSGVALAGARQGSIPLEPPGFQPDWDAVDPRGARLAVLNYPSNPCAVCEAPGTFEASVAWAQRHGCWLLHDLAYGFLAFDGRRARSLLEVEGAREVAVELWSASKVYGMAGWRIGFALGSPVLIARIQRLLDHMFVGVWTGLQRGLLAALGSDQQDVVARHAVYAARRARLAQAMAGAGAEMAAPEGTFYAWWRLPRGVTAERLATELRVGVAPGAGFGARGAGWARLSLAVPDEDLDEAVRRFGRLL